MTGRRRARTGDDRGTPYTGPENQQNPGLPAGGTDWTSHDDTDWGRYRILDPIEDGSGGPGTGPAPQETRSADGPAANGRSRDRVREYGRGGDPDREPEPQHDYPSDRGYPSDHGYPADRDAGDRTGHLNGRVRDSGPAPRIEPDDTPLTGGIPASRHRRRDGGRVSRDDEGKSGGKSGGKPPARRTPLASAVGAVTEIVVVVAMALALALVIKTFLVQAFFIPTSSMEDTLLIGDRVLVSKLTPGPLSLHRGDIVVFKDPGGWLPPPLPVEESPLQHTVRTGLTFVGLLPQDSGEHLIKRVIGLPGDTVTCCDAEGRLQVNGVSIEETYIYPGNEPSAKEFSVTLPAGQRWVMGDHRAVSEDSRYHENEHGGTVPMSDVVGRAFVIVWPLGQAGSLGTPPSVFARVPDPPSG
ncbi:MAG: signal peptidase I [Kineosporiaceae bacterium]